MRGCGRLSLVLVLVAAVAGWLYLARISDIAAAPSPHNHDTDIPTMAAIPAIVIPAVKRHTATLIFLHGLGDTGSGWASISESFRARSNLDECAFIFPNAPNIPITVNNGMRMPGWFDVMQFGGNVFQRKEDVAGITKSVSLLHSLVESQLAQGVAPERIIVGGFSQGGAIALLGGLSAPHKLGGIIALSTWLPLSDRVESMVTAESKDTPIFQAHGKVDPVIQFVWAEMSAGILKDKLKRNVEFHAYENLAHSADPREIETLTEWIERRVPPMDK